MNVPGAWEAVLLALAAYRLTRLAGWDDFPLAVRLRAWATGEETPEQQFIEDLQAAFAQPVENPGEPTPRLETVILGDPAVTVRRQGVEVAYPHDRLHLPEPEPVYRRPTLAKLLTCPFCAGFWISLAVYGCWQAWPHGTLVAAAALAIASAVGLTAKNLDP